MYLKEISIYNFRKFKMASDGSPGITVNLNPNFNLIIGENDTGKTAIIDGIRYLLGSISDDYERMTQEDFSEIVDGTHSDSFMIEGVFTDLTSKEAGAFLEWVSIDENNEYSLTVTLKVEKKINNNGIEYIDRKLLGGEKDFQQPVNGSARNLLKTTYLKPLRDAGSELKPGFKSRLVNILKAHPLFKVEDENSHELVTVMQRANEQIEGYFDSEYIEGHSLKKDIEDILSSFYDSLEQTKSNAQFTVTDSNLTSILRKLTLSNEDINLGLGNQNLLFIATELLLINNYLEINEKIGPEITLIEEIEAHLHPQAQIRLIKFLESELESNGNSNQFILTSHSPNLIASVNIKNIILIHNQKSYPMSNEFTCLDTTDYKFLERFLDVTKSNLFFAKGIIFVEGVSEMLLLPAIANLTGYPLHQHGISIVNINGTSFERYIKLFSRSKLWIEEMGLTELKIPISIVTDVDVKPYVYYELEEIPNSYFSIDNEMELSRIQSIINENSLSTEYIGYTYSTLKKMAKDFDFIVTDENEELLSQKSKKEITKEYIETIDKQKREDMIEKYNTYNGNFKTLIAPEWTLEYSLAQSVLAEYLYKSIHYIRYKQPPSARRVQEKAEIIEEIRGEHITDIEKSKLAYRIFKPLNDKLVSKGEVAQVLSTRIEDLIKKSPHEAEILKNKVLNDDNLIYLVEAIKHAASEYIPQDEEDDDDE